MLARTLELDAGERAGSRKVFGGYVDEERCVGISAGTGIEACAVNAKMLALR